MAVDYENAWRALVEESDVHGLSELSERLAQQMRDITAPLLVMVVGEGKFGKSSLINALAGVAIAPVSRLPKTWKVDLYESFVEGEPQALLYRRQAPDRPELVGIEAAVAVCEHEERIANEASHDAISWKSDLVQVRWRVPMPLLPHGSTLVDTPGFAQFRNGEEIPGIRLYGANGFVMRPSEAFEFYYHRANVVLWCLKATKLEDQDTLAALDSLGRDEKLRIGVLTHMDRIPPEQRGEVMDRATEIYGEYLPSILPVAAIPGSSLHESSIGQLRSLLTQRFFSQSDRWKVTCTERALEKETGALVEVIDKIASAGLGNARRRFEALHRIERMHADALESGSSEIERTWDRARRAGVARLEELWNSAGGETDAFVKAVERHAVRMHEVADECRRHGEAVTATLRASMTSLFGSLRWDGVSIASGRATAVSVPAAATVTYTSAAQARRGPEVQLHGAEGAAAAVGVGLLGGAIGALVFGPVGLLGAGLALLSRGIFKKGEAIKKASDAIAEACHGERSRQRDEFRAWVERSRSLFHQAVERSFEAHHGGGLRGLHERARRADRTMSRLGRWANGHEPLAVPPQLRAFYGSSIAFYGPAFAECDQELLEAWNREVIDAWYAAQQPWIARRLHASGGLFDEDFRSLMIEEFAVSLRAAIGPLTRARRKARQFDVDFAGLLVEIGLPNRLQGVLPDLQSIVSESRNRLEPDLLGLGGCDPHTEALSRHETDLAQAHANWRSGQDRETIAVTETAILGTAVGSGCIGLYVSIIVAYFFATSGFAMFGSGFWVFGLIVALLVDSIALNRVFALLDARLAYETDLANRIETAIEMAVDSVRSACVRCYPRPSANLDGAP